MISLIPYVREAFRRHLSQKQGVMLVEFDKLKRVCTLPLKIQVRGISLRIFFF